MNNFVDLGAGHHTDETQKDFACTTLIADDGHSSCDSLEAFAPVCNPIVEEGRCLVDNLQDYADLDNHPGSEVHSNSETLDNPANTSNPIADGGHTRPDTQTRVAPVCDSLRELHRQRQDLHRAEKSLTLQIKAKCRRLAAGDKTEAEKVYKSMLNGCQHDLAMFALTTTLPFINARSMLESERKTVEKQMTKEAKKLPVYPWVESVKGFGALGFAQVVGEAGDLSNYATVSRLWKRLGLAVIEGGRQRKVAGPDSLKHGYNPSRRSVVWNIGDSLFRANGPYSDVCRDRKEVERQKAADEGLTVCPSAKIPAKDKENYRSDGHIHNRAKRYMEKRLIRDLWRAWRDFSGEGHEDCENHIDGA